MFSSIFKCTLMVYMGILCSLNTPSEKSIGTTSIAVFFIEVYQLFYETNTAFDIPIEESVETSLIESCEFSHDSNEIIVTFVGLEIYFYSVDNVKIITSIDLYDMNQQLVLSENFTQPVSSAIVDISRLVSGHYVAIIRKTNGVESFQFQR